MNEQMTAAKTGDKQFTLYRMSNGNHFRTITVPGTIESVTGGGSSVTVVYVTSGSRYMAIFSAPTWSQGTTRGIGRA